MTKGLFDDAQVIYAYTDEDAVEDGVLVALDKTNRVTRSVFEWLVKSLTNKPPDSWPVELLGYFKSNDADLRTLAATRGLIGMYGNDARRVYEKNLDGGIWNATVRYDRDLRTGKETVVALHPASKTAGDAAHFKTLWLLPNELGGLTLMFPEDY